MTATLDVTAVPPAVRHNQVYAALDRLGPGETLPIPRLAANPHRTPRALDHAPPIRCVGSGARRRSPGDPGLGQRSGARS